MKTMGAFDAKTHFSQILSLVEKGETVSITRHGHRVALITPVYDDEITPARAAIEKIKRLSKGRKLGKGISIKALKEQGRR